MSSKPGLPAYIRLYLTDKEPIDIPFMNYEAYFMANEVITIQRYLHVLDERKQFIHIVSLQLFTDTILPGESITIPLAALYES